MCCLIVRLLDHTLSKFFVVLVNEYFFFYSKCLKVIAFFRQHRAIIEQSHPRAARHQLEHIHSESFAGWFAQYVSHIIKVIVILNI